MKTEIKNLESRVDKIRESSPPSPDKEAIIVEFINGLPRELHDQIVEYVKHRVHELEGETKTN